MLIFGVLTTRSLEGDQMRFGIVFLGSCPHGDFKRTYDEILAQIEYAEELGFEAVWLTEHHRSVYGTFPSAAVFAAAIAERTQTMRIGISVAILPFQNPVRIAEEWAMVDVLSGGRLNFGVGRGYQPREFEVMLADPVKSREVFAESLDIILGLWETDTTFTYHGEHFHFDDIEIVPKPLQRPVPVWVGAFSPETFELCARKGLQFMVAPGLKPLDVLKDGMVRAARLLIESGRSPSKIDFPMNMMAYVAPTVEQAKATIREPLGWFFDQLVREGVTPGAGGKPAPKSFEAYAEVDSRVGGAPTLEGLIESGTALVSDPTGARARVRELHDDVGLKQLNIGFNTGDVAHEDVLRAMELWANEVIPAFRDETPVPASFRAGAVATHLR
jgi:alkanesulfonate monooxygenase SsuD/methylene tetrahydromethanopterin reductase-like flavin-dependent oxidoreductase (luciferase family)